MRTRVQAATAVRSWPPRALAALGITAAALVAFGGLVDGVTEHGDLSSYDPGITSALASLRPTGLTLVAELVTTVGSEVSIGVLTLLSVAWLWFARRDRSGAVLFAATMAVAAALTLGVKHVLGRHRPPAAFVVGPVDTGYSFPSGHTVFSTVFLGMVAMVVVWPAVGRRGRVAAAVGWAVASGMIGATRVYLGYHWATDVLAAWALGVAVLAVALALTTIPVRFAAAGSATTGDDGEGAGDASPGR